MQRGIALAHGTEPAGDAAGRPAEADWDCALIPAMAALGIALREEAALDLLVDDLR